VNEPQKRRVAATFQHVDELLQTAVQALAGEGAGSPFSSLVPDAAPIQHRVVSDYAQRVRDRMAAALQRLDIPLHPPTIPATRSAFTHVMFAEVDIEDIDPNRMKGYGDLLPEDSQALEETGAEILALLGQMHAYLKAGSTTDLEARLVQSSAPTGLRSLLQDLARVVTAHGLVAFRPALESLVEASEHGSFEIALFGPVSSGKSSLLNHVLGQPVLPVGVTPVTALVTHISYGPEPKACIQFALATPRVVGLEELSAFATEQGNPANQKQVVSIRIELPEERLKSGINFVDTPGLGSLASSGAAETMAYLPRADLGVFLIDATGTLTAGELLTLDALHRAGVMTMVVLSKADLLSPEDRLKVKAYVSQRLQTELGREVPVHFVSVIGADASLADQWFDSEISPLLAAHHDRQAESLARKAGLLKDRVLNLLRQRAGQGASLSAPPTGAVLAEADQALRRVEGLTGRTQSACRELLRDLMKGPEASLTQAVSGLADARDLTNAQALLVQAIEAQVLPLHTRILKVLDETRGALGKALSLAGAVRGVTEDQQSLPMPQGLPIFEFAPLARQLIPEKLPSHWLPVVYRKYWLGARIRGQIGTILDDAFQSHRQRLEAWCQGYLAELEPLFQERAGTIRALRDGASAQDEPSPEASLLLESDIHALEGHGDSV
jgi:GTP-binding protein EngB required for normal cell division